MKGSAPASVARTQYSLHSSVIVTPGWPISLSAQLVVDGTPSHVGGGLRQVESLPDRRVVHLIRQQPREAPLRAELLDELDGGSGASAGERYSPG